MFARICLLVCGLLFLAMHQPAAAAGLFELAQKGTAAEIKDHLARHKESPDDLTRALFHAIENKASDDVLELLVKSGADVNGCTSILEMDGGSEDQGYEVDGGDEVAYEYDTDWSGYSPLEMALHDTRMATQLLRLGANPDVCQFEGKTPLFLEVIKKEPTPLLHALLQAGADPNWPLHGPVCPRPDGEIEGVPCVVLEFALHSPAIVRTLLDAGARSNHHIYALATQNRSLPTDLLQRLDPTLLPDGSPKTPDSLISQAIDSYRTGNMKGCRAALEDLNRSFELPKPVLSAHYFLRSICSDNDLEDAEKALRYDPSQARNHRQYISSLLQQQRYKEALRALPSALKLTPDDARLYLYRATCHMQAGSIREAEKDLDKAASLKDLPQMWMQRGELALLQQRPDLAAQHFKTALDKGQKHDADSTWLYLAALQEYAGKQDEARHSLQQRVRVLNPDGTKGALDSFEQNLGSTVMMPFGLLARALKNFHYWRGEIVSAQACNWRETINGTVVDLRKSHLEWLAEKSKEYSLPQEKAAIAYLESFCLADVAQQLKKTALALRFCPKEPVYHYHHGQLLLQEGQYADAKKHLQQAVSLGQKNGLVRNLLAQARIAHEQGVQDSASQLVKQADTYAHHESEKRLVAAATAALLVGTDWPDLSVSPTSRKQEPSAEPASPAPAASVALPDIAAPSAVEPVTPPAPESAAPSVELLSEQPTGPASPPSPADNSPISVELLRLD